MHASPVRTPPFTSYTILDTMRGKLEKYGHTKKILNYFCRAKDASCLVLTETCSNTHISFHSRYKWLPTKVKGPNIDFESKMAHV